MTTPQNQHAKGLALTALGGLVLTIDIPLIKLADGDSWSILLLRSAATLLAALVIWGVWRRFGRNAPELIPGKAGWAVALLYGLSSMTFIMAVFTTSTANVVFILAFNTMFSALLSWGFLGERPAFPTLAAMAAMIIGVGIIVSDSLGSGNLLGDLLAALSAFLIASAITVTRASGKDMGFTALVAVALPLCVAAFMVFGSGSDGLQVKSPGWILFNGALVMPLAFFCLATGPKYISGPEVAMFYLLETVLAPIWVWIIFSEAPTTRSLIGGVILVVALLAHSLWQIWNNRRKRPMPGISYPA